MFSQQYNILQYKLHGLAIMMHWCIMDLLIGLHLASEQELCTWSTRSWHRLR